MSESVLKRALCNPFLPLSLAVMTLVVVPDTSAQQTGLERLPADVFDAAAPSVRVRGVPGTMSVHPRPCRTLPTTETRRRIVDVAVQEWGFFGFRLAAATDVEDDAAFGNDTNADGSPFDRRRRSRLPPAEAARVAASIAGYWAVTSEGPWIVARQNDRWNGPDGIAARWNAPWSAAFVSWVMCEAGLGATTQFARAIAHHTYIDQAIRARDGRASEAAFVAYDPGDVPIAPGDLLCSSRRPAYRSIAERRRHTGVGARSHCDVVVKVDEAEALVLAIGGNVRGIVSLKTLPAVRKADGVLRPHTGNDDRPMFAHLKLRAAPIGAHALDASPTVVRSVCAAGSVTRAARLAPPLAAAGTSAVGC